MTEQKLPPISPDYPIKIYPDGNMWCALFGEDLQSGYCGFGKTPEEALGKLLKDQDEGVWQHFPHQTVEVTCWNCGHHQISILPYPFSGEIRCSKCHANTVP